MNISCSYPNLYSHISNNNYFNLIDVGDIINGPLLSFNGWGSPK